MLCGFRVNRAVGNRLYPFKMPAGLKPGMALYRNNDMEFERLMAGKTAERKIPLTMTLEAVDGGFRLNGIFFAAEHQQAQKPQQENIIRQLTKLGGTPYECHSVQLVPNDFNYFIPSSQLAEWRRQLVSSLNNETESPSLREGRGGLPITPNPYPREGSVDGWGKYGLKGQNKSAQGNALGIVRNQHSPRMGKRIIIPFTPFATLQWWAVILLPPFGGVSMLHPLPPGVTRGWHINAPFGA